MQRVSHSFSATAFQSSAVGLTVLAVVWMLALRSPRSVSRELTTSTGLQGLLLGIRFVLARSYERIHRSNLVGMGVLPLQFPDGESVASLGIDGEETFDLAPLEEGATTLRVSTSTGVAFDARVRIDTPNEWQYFRHGGILHFVLRQLRASRPRAR